MDLVQRVNWDEYFLILSQGNPPIALQLIVLNVALLAYWLHMRMRKPKTRNARKSPQGSGLGLQMAFVACNVGVVMLGSRLAF